MGKQIDNYTLAESVEQALKLINVDAVSQVVTINPEMFAQAEKDAEFSTILNEAEMVIPDGVGIKIALKLKGKSINRIPGIDFSKNLLFKAKELNLPVAIIGSKEDVIIKAVENLQSEIEGLNIVYYHDGYFSDENEIYNKLSSIKPKIVLVALGSPKQEYFIYRAKTILSPCLMVGIGGSLDVWSGKVKRAPVIFQKLGLEWLYRTVSEPHRFKRIFPALPLFLLKTVLYKKDKVC